MKSQKDCDKTKLIYDKYKWAPETVTIHAIQVPIIISWFVNDELVSHPTILLEIRIEA